MEIAKAYDPQSAETTHYQKWEAAGCFAPEINQNPDAPKFSIVIPPPNVTGSLHLGHALQHTLMDVLTRRKRMLGFRALWLPGTDHAGISTQLQVTKKLWADEKKTRWDVGRERFVEMIWDWKRTYENEIKNQIRREGASVDWSRERFTLDENLSRAVREVFVTLYEEKQIYRGFRIVNWCPKDKTVLSDLEVKEDKKLGKLVYLQYPIVNSERKITVATTRPETMLGDTAVAVNPTDERYQDLIGQMIALPLTNREIPIVADDYVDAGFGTGAVKITPAHDANDYAVGLRHNLEQLTVMNDDATMNDNAGAEFVGLDRFAAREKVVEKFEELGLLEKEEDYEIALPLCERCGTILEPLLSEQWFVRMDELRDVALDLMRTEKSPRFVPETPYEKTYTAWLENLKDWTISRQLWWGHQIPAWYDSRGNVFVARNFEEAAEKAGTRELTQDQDVLDTWFSSGLWAFSTLGWTGESDAATQRHSDAANDSETSENVPASPSPQFSASNDLEVFLPTDVLVTGRDIINLWVARMVMLTEKFVGKKPFDAVIVTGTVVDKNGQKMSKTKGNVVDPLVLFDKFGVDATRAYLASVATGADIRLNETQIETYRNFANKIWNATRFCLLNSDGAQVDLDSLKQSENLSIADKWIISRLAKTASSVNKSLENYQFHEAVGVLYHFFWDDFCDWYIELVKDEITAQEPSPKRDAARTRILTVLEQALRLLHPLMPFLTEELWQMLPGTTQNLHNAAYSKAEKTIMLADFPIGDADLIDERAENEMQAVIELISKVRNIRAEMNIKPSEKVELRVSANQNVQTVFAQNKAQILKLSRAADLHLSDKLEAPKASARAALSDAAEVAVPLEGLIDFAKETERVEKELAKLNQEKDKLIAQLSNENFVSRAPQEKVDEIRARVVDIEQRTKILNQTLEALK